MTIITMIFSVLTFKIEAIISGADTHVARRLLIAMFSIKYIPGIRSFLYLNPAVSYTILA